LLADPRVRLFITHAGLNSIIESTYHGKPIITFPIGLDQPNNAQMAASKGFGIRMDIGDFDAEGLLSAIDAVLTDSKYRLNAERASAIMRDRRQTPAERVSDAIEHVIKYGEKDLRTAAFDLNVMQFIMFDIFAFIFVVFIAISAATISVCCVVRRRCCSCRCRPSKRKAD
jgi:UDP-glucoronosyl and UDP-glucosyl transferase